MPRVVKSSSENMLNGFEVVTFYPIYMLNTQMSKIKLKLASQVKFLVQLVQSDHDYGMIRLVKSLSNYAFARSETHLNIGGFPIKQSDMTNDRCKAECELSVSCRRSCHVGGEFTLSRGEARAGAGRTDSA